MRNTGKGERRFRRIIETVGQMSEDKMIYLCFYASDEDFDEEMNKLKRLNDKE